MNTEYTKMKREQDVFCESSADYTLPDYNGDIKKVIYTSATAIPNAKYADGDTVSASGVVSYDMIYLDSEDRMNRISYTSDYDFDVKLSGEEYVACDVETRLSGYTHRIFGPRRVNFKSNLVSEIRLNERVNMLTEGIEENDDTEYARDSASLEKTLFIEGAEREYSEELVRLDGAVEDETEVLYLTATTSVEDSVAGEGELTVKGSYTVNAVIRSDGSIVAYRINIPFDERIENEEITPDMNVYVVPKIASLSSSVNPDDDGVSVTVSLIGSFDARLYTNVPIDYVSEAYLKGSDYENKYEKMSFTTNLTCERVAFEVEESLPLSDLTDMPVRDILFAGASGRVTGVNAVGSSAEVNLEEKITLILSSVDENGEQNVFSVKAPINIKKNVNLNCQIPANSRVEYRIITNDINASIDGESVYFDIRVVMNVVASEDKTVQRLASISPVADSAHEIKKNVISVYYPQPEDTLFDVARKFHTSAHKIAADNMLTEAAMAASTEPSSLGGVRRLLIKY
ncbi:MAG: DUF3794 domain-containing protein [Clostridia bacterium]|nr:DUF3794 domain-containing protein [Clostridia bacterium]